MTDSDIIKSSEYCVGERSRRCSKCPCDRYGAKTLADCRGILLGHTLDLNKRQKAENERLQAEHDALIRNYKECAMEAVKAFAERLKEVAQDYGHGDAVLLTRYQIDSAVKEMEGQK